MIGWRAVALAISPRLQLHPLSRRAWTSCRLSGTGNSRQAAPTPSSQSTRRSGTGSRSPTRRRWLAELFARPESQFAANATSDRAFPLAAVRNIENFTRGTARVQFKLIAGASDQLAGLVFNLRPERRVSRRSLQHEGGQRRPLEYRQRGKGTGRRGHQPRQAGARRWHTLELHVADRKITGTVNGTLRVEHRRDEPVAAASVSGPSPTACRRSRDCAFRSRAGPVWRQTIQIRGLSTTTAGSR